MTAGNALSATVTLTDDVTERPDASVMVTVNWYCPGPKNVATEVLAAFELLALKTGPLTAVGAAVAERPPAS